MDIQRVGIVGCGLMGSGIAQCAAEAGCQVRVKEAEETFLAKGLARIHGAWDRAVAKGKVTEEQRSAWQKNLQGTLSFATLADCDLVVEAIPERLDLKGSRFCRGIRPGRGKARAIQRNTVAKGGCIVTGCGHRNGHKSDRARITVLVCLRYGVKVGIEQGDRRRIGRRGRAD